eukprot:g4853.t1
MHALTSESLKTISSSFWASTSSNRVLLGAPVLFSVPRRTSRFLISSSSSSGAKLDDLSYSKQYDELFKEPLNPRRAVPKPSFEAQRLEPDGKKVLLSDVVATKKRSLFNRHWNQTDIGNFIFIFAMHALACFAPMTYSFRNLMWFVGTYFATGCLGITLSYHRQLSHRSFNTPKWIEYFFAYCGVLAGQGDPREWVSSHRYHHVHTDTPLDPHSPYEGFFWSHMGWLLDNKVTLDRVGTRTNRNDMKNEWFYQWLEKTYAWHMVGMFLVLYALGGLPVVIWGGALRLVFVYHVTWFVNSACHCWGYQQYKTSDLSRNNWWVALLAFGEGWHNNHHAFEYSARHGFEWWQFDITWMIISLLEKLGLAKDVKLPSEQQKKALEFAK